MSSQKSQFQPVRVLIPALVALLPVVHSMVLYRWFMVPQQALLLVALGILTGAGIAGSARWLKAESLAVRVSVGSLAVVVLWLGLGSAMGVDPRRSLVTDDFQGTSWMFWVVCLFLFIAAVRFRNDLAVPVSRATVLSLGILVALTAICFLGGDLVQETLVPLSPEGLPLPGIGNSAFLGAFYGAACLIALGRWLTPHNRYHGLLFLSAAAFSLMVLTQSRVSLFATIGLLALGLGGNRVLGRRRLFLLLAMFSAVGIGTQILAVPSLDPPGRTKVEEPEGGEAATKFERAAIQGGFNIRRGLWGAALKAAGNNPFIGVGANNFSHAYTQFASEEDRDRVAVQFDNAVNDAHNLLLEVAATGGIPAFLALLLFMVAVVVSILAQRRDAYDPKLWLGLGAAILLAESMFQPLNLVSIPLMLTFGALAMSEAPHPGSANFKHRPILLAAGAVPVVVAVMVAWSLLYSDYRLRTGSLEWTPEDLEAAVATNPYCTRCLFELGKIRRWDHIKSGKGTASEAIAPNVIAVDRHPSDPEGYVQLGGGLLFMKQPARALPQFEKALRLDPHSWLAGQGMAAALIRLERFSDALPYLQESVRRNPTPGGFQLLADIASKAGSTELAATASTQAERLRKQNIQP